MVKTMKIFAILAITVLATTSLAFGQANSLKVPYAYAAVVPCADGGNGEVVLLTGTLHIVEQSRIDSNGGEHLQTQFQPMGVIAVGQTTGDIYRAVGVTRESRNTIVPEWPYETTYVNNFKIIGPGPDNNLLVHENWHITINNNGEFTATVDNASIKCQ